MVDVDLPIDSLSEGLFHVKTFITPSSKVYYVVSFGYFNNGKYQNQRFVVLDSEVIPLMCLLRRALLMSKRSCAELYHEELVKKR